MFNDDLDIYFSDFGKIVTFDSRQFKGILDMPEIEIGGFIDESCELTIKTIDAVEINEGSIVQIDNKDYEVLNKIKIDDGDLTKISIRKS